MSTELEALIVEARDPSTDSGRLWSLRNHPEVEVHHALLDNPNLCPTQADGKLDTRLLEELAQEFPEKVAAHPAFVLHALVEPNGEMKLMVMEVVERTKDVDLIEHVLRTWGSWSSGVRQSVAQNPWTPMDILRILGNEKTESKWMVRAAVAQNPRTPEDLLRTLSNPKTEPDDDVRQAVAWNPSTPMDLLRTLSNQETESEASVRQAAQKALAERGLT